MLHLKGIGFENFRVFKDKTYFSLAPITILTGINSSGKSSVINGLRLISKFNTIFVLEKGKLMFADIIEKRWVHNVRFIRVYNLAN